MVAIEKLIGQSIPRAEGDYEIQAESSDGTERPREARGRERSRGGRGKPQRGRERSHEPREARGEARHASEPKHATEARQPSEARHRPDDKRRAEPRHDARQQANNSHVPSIGRPEPRRQREIDAEPGDHSHLPAFLLRPVRSPAGA
jgi:hypothetical protein